MRIAYIMYPGACYIGSGDGSKMQGKNCRGKGILLNELTHGDIMSGKVLILYMYLGLDYGIMI